MKYLLDTCCFSDFVKGDKNTHENFKKCSPSDLALSSISVMEIQYGLFHNPERAKKIYTLVQEILSRIIILPFCKEEAYHSATTRSGLRKKGSPIGSYDILIAGTALQHKLILVTSNENEFNRIENLTIENWR